MGAQFFVTLYVTGRLRARQMPTMPSALVLLGQVGGPKVALPCTLGASVVSGTGGDKKEVAHSLDANHVRKVHCLFGGPERAPCNSSRGRTLSLPLAVGGAEGGGKGDRGDGGLLRFLPCRADGRGVVSAVDPPAPSHPNPAIACTGPPDR